MIHRDAFQAARTPAITVGNKGHSLTSKKCRIEANKHDRFFSSVSLQISSHIITLYKGKTSKQDTTCEIFWKEPCIIYMYFLHYIVRRYQNTAYNYNNLKQDSIHVLYFERLTLRLKDRRNYVTMIFPLCPVNKQKILRKEYFIRTNTLKNLTVILSLFMSCVCQEPRKIEQNKRITPSQFLLRRKSPNSKQMNSWQCFFLTGKSFQNLAQALITLGEPRLTFLSNREL